MTTSNTARAIAIESIFAQAIYVEDFDSALGFYCNVLGLERTSSMGTSGAFLKIGDNPQAIYLEGGHPRRTPDSNSSGVSFMMLVPDAMAAYKELISAGVVVVQDSPVDMGSGSYWFQFFDPAGNLLEIVTK